MRSIDLDNVISETRNTIRYLSDIDVDDKYSDISMGKILSEIEELSKDMRQSNNYIHKKHQIRKVSFRETKKVRLIRNIDKKLRRISYYDRAIRPALSKNVGSVMDRKIISSKDLLKYNGEEFIDVLYRSILCRETDKLGRVNAINFLHQPYIGKIDLLYSIANSEEAKSKNLIIKGMKSRKIISSLKRKIYRLPIIGHIIQLIIYLCLLPKRLNDIKNRFDRFDNFVNEIDTNIKEDNSRIKREKEIMDRFYLRYNEILMPDSREEVKNRARIYIDKLNGQFKYREKDKLICIDLGCGEGEWIELLHENGYNAIGIDNNSAVIKKVRKNLPELKIMQMEAFQYLKTLENDSVDLLTSFHMVEHLEMIELINLLGECKRVLKKNGILIVETPNPQNIMTSSYYFNMDPTHKKPIPPELLAFFISESELKVIDKILLYPLNFIPYDYEENDPIRDIVFRFNMEQAYSIMAEKE